MPTAKYKTNQIAQCWKIKEKVDFLSKRAKRALNVMEGCDKKSVHSEKRAMKKRVLRKACAQESFSSNKRALKKACAQESVRSEKRADSKCVFWR